MALTRLKFVTAISATPTVVLDLNDGVTFTLDDDSFDFSPPDIRRAESSTILSDGGVVSATVPDNRTLAFTLLVQASSRDLLRTAQSNLHTQLSATRNVIEFRHRDSTSSRFFRTFASPNVTVVDAGEPGYLTIRCSVLAEPYAYGPLVTQAGITVYNDPYAGAHPCYLDVTGVLGDVPTPAILTVSQPTNVSFAFGIRRHGTPSNALPWVIQAEDMAISSALTVLGSGTDAVMSGTGAAANYMRTTIPAGPLAMATMLNKAMTGLTVDHRGTYRVFVRCRRVSSATDVIRIRVNYAGIPLDAVVYRNPEVITPTNTATHLLDLGLVSYPVSSDPVTSSSGATLGVGDSYVSVSISRDDGASAFIFDWDYLVFVPADEELTIVDAPSTSGSADLVLDGDRGTAYYTASGKVASRQFPAIAGAIAPMLQPGATNRLIVLRNVLAKAAVPNSISETEIVTVAHLPRYLYV